MIERNYPSYFDIIDIVDKALLPKDQQDYTQMTIENIIKKFNEVIEQSGFYFKEENLVNARRAIEYYFANTYGRKSNFLGGFSKSIDQNNYFIQNQLSAAKTAIIHNLANTERLLSPEFTGIIDTNVLGNVEELRQRMTREKVEEYIRSVMICSWEERDTIRPQANILANDIMLHFGIRPSGNYGRESEVCKKLRDMITSFELSSRTFYGPIDREGYYQRSETKLENYSKGVEDTIRHMTDYVYSILKDSLDKTEEFEEKRKREREKTPVLKITPPNETAEVAPTVDEEVSVEELESTISQYEEAQSLIAENVELQKKLAALVKEAEEIKAKIARNNAKIQNTLGGN